MISPTLNRYSLVKLNFIVELTSIAQPTKHVIHRNCDLRSKISVHKLIAEKEGAHHCRAYVFKEYIDYPNFVYTEALTIQLVEVVRKHNGRIRNESC